MHEDVEKALRISPDAGMAERIIDITTTGRRSQEPRRIETAFHRVGESVYLSGIPAPRPRAWLLNLAADPNFTFHLKHGVTADLPATATVITDEAERREILTPIVERFLATRDPHGPFPESSLDDWVQHSPLARVTFLEE